MTTTSLIRKYNIPGPRYTSYPTVPHWHRSPSEQEWAGALRERFALHHAEEGLSLYIHLPFCESLCTYCGCNTRITKNHGVEQPYLQYLLKELKMYVAILGEKPRISELHFGGGTPTFFSPDNLDALLSGLFSHAERVEGAAFSFEGHPNNTTTEHLKVLYRWGFRRMSLGVQDFKPEVQELINRKQSYEQVARITQAARDLGYTSVNYDLVFGLPLQTIESVEKTIAQVMELRPDRIAYYSYAHVPWLKPAQKMLEPFLPEAETKRRLYELGKQQLEAAGYVEIGMDHFALPSDALYQASQNGQLHRNFMGYTTESTHIMLGLGVSSISDAWGAFAQNVKKVEDYYALLDEGRLPLLRGHLLDSEEVWRRQHILDLMCRLETRWEAGNSPLCPSQIPQLEIMQADGLLELGKTYLRMTEAGRPFVRNACMALDPHLQKAKQKAQFSKTI